VVAAAGEAEASVSFAAVSATVAAAGVNGVAGVAGEAMVMVVRGGAAVRAAMIPIPSPAIIKTQV
jgi:hypothetical protein